MQTKKTSQQLVETPWTHTPDLNGDYSYQQLVAAAAIETTRLLRVLVARAEMTNRLLSSVGEDGIDLVVREMAREARAKALRRRKAEAAKHRKAKAAKAVTP
jgi:hypothetical protein